MAITGGGGGSRGVGSGPNSLNGATGARGLALNRPRSLNQITRPSIGSRIVDTIKNMYRNPGTRNPGARTIRPR
jgi:hypothetical protein